MLLIIYSFWGIHKGIYQHKECSTKRINKWVANLYTKY